MMRRNSMDKIAVLIPCYNEEKTIQKVVTDFKSVLPNSTVYVYDNNSTDNSVSLAEQAGAIVRYEYCQGKGNVIRRMFREIDAEAYIIVDADDTYPAEDAPEMVRLILEQHADMVGLSALMTTTVPAMENTIKLLREQAPWVKVAVGGAVMTQKYSDSIGADRFCRDAMETVRYAEELNNSIK